MVLTVLAAAPKIDDRIVFVLGDDVEVRRTVAKLPEDQTVAQAWLTIKEKLSDTDAAAILQKIIPTAELAGTGQIEDDGAEGKALLRFDLTPEDTILFTPGNAYCYDVQIKTSAGK